MLDELATAMTPAGAAARNTLLIVDDVPTNLRILVEALRDEYTLRVATGGADALRLASSQNPDLVLLDVMMPEIDGYEVCRRLKADPATRHIPIIFVSGRGEESDELQGLSIGAVDYIAKPFSIPIVQARIATHLELKRYRDLMESRSYIDGLTNLPNRRRFDEALQQAWASALRRRSPVSLVLIDVDHFKAFNDHYGHQGGDHCLIEVGRALRSVLRRGSDLMARYGGEEFVALLPDTDQQGGLHVAELLRQAVEALQLPHEYSSASHLVSISLGVATTLPTHDETPQALIEAADKGLYAAKGSGRNRVCAAPES